MQYQHFPTCTKLHKDISNSSQVSDYLYICGNILLYREAAPKLYYVNDRQKHNTNYPQPYTTFLYQKL